MRKVQTLSLAPAAVLLAALWPCPNARAEESHETHHEEPYLVEVSAGATAALAIGTGSPATTTFVIDGGAAIPLTEPWLDFALDATFTTSDSTGVRLTDLTVVPGVQINFGEKDVRDDFFFFGGGGFALASAAFRTDTHFTYRLRAGKRFELTTSISYAPFVAYTKTATMDGEVDLVPLAFSLFL